MFYTSLEVNEEGWNIREKLLSPLSIPIIQNSNILNIWIVKSQGSINYWLNLVIWWENVLKSQDIFLSK